MLILAAAIGNLKPTIKTMKKEMSVENYQKSLDRLQLHNDILPLLCFGQLGTY